MRSISIGFVSALVALTLLSGCGTMRRTTAGVRAQGHGGGGGGGTLPMGRLRTVGYEIGQGSIDSIDGSVTVVGAGSAGTSDTTLFRSGAASLRCVTGSGTNPSAYSTLVVPGTVAAGTTIFVRAYVNFDHIPGVQTGFLYLQTVLAANLVHVALTTTGHLQLINDVSGLQVGSDSAVLSPGVWYRVELAVKMNLANTPTDYAELLLDGGSVASSTGLNLNTAPPSRIPLGWSSAGGEANEIINIDDVAVNDSLGTMQTSWPGSGKVVLLVPRADQQNTDWTGGAGGVATLFNGVKNRPPAGLAAASETNTSQIKDLVSSITSDYIASMTDYSTQGIQSTDTITLVHAVCDTSQVILTGTKNGALRIASNPNQAVENSFVYGSGTAAAGTWPAGWVGIWGTPQYGDIPAGSRGTFPTLLVGKRTATTREVDVDFMGIYVEYVTGGAVAATSHRLALLGVGH